LHKDQENQKKMIFQEKHPECGEHDDVYDPDDSNLTKFVANAIVPCVKKRLIYDNNRKKESMVMNMALKQSMLRSNNSHITRKNMSDTHFYDQYPECGTI